MTIAIDDIYDNLNLPFFHFVRIVGRILHTNENQAHQTGFEDGVVSLQYTDFLYHVPSSRPRMTAILFILIIETYRSLRQSSIFHGRLCAARLRTLAAP